MTFDGRTATPAERWPFRLEGMLLRGDRICGLIF
jgi:hypothetical protein